MIKNNEVKMSKEQRLSILKKEVLETMFVPELYQEHYLRLRKILPEYLKLKMGFEEVDIEFVPKKSSLDASLNFDCNKININLNKFNIENEQYTPYQKILKITDLVTTVFHELAHYIDKKQDKEHNANRFYIGRRSEILSEIAKVYPEKKELYKNTIEALYYADRAENYARQLSAIETKLFLEEVKEYKDKRFQLTTKTKQEYEEYLSYLTKYKTNPETPFPTLCDETKDYIVANSRVNILQNKLEENNKIEKETLNWALITKNNNIEEIKEDINKVVDLFVGPYGVDIRVMDVDIDMFAYLENIPEIFDQNTAQKLFKFYKELNYDFYCGVLCESPKFEISDKEREKYLKEANRSKPKLLEQKPEQKNEETFHLD